MGLLDLLRKLRGDSDRELRLLLLGLDNAGKTTLLKHLAHEKEVETTPTLGFNVKTVQTNGFKLNVWDIGGQRGIRSYWKNYYDGTDFLIFVIDSSDKKRFDEAKEIFMELLDDEKLAKVPLLVFANKQDLRHAAKTYEISDIFELDSMSREKFRHVQGCSALNGTGVEEGLAWMAKTVKQIESQKKKKSASEHY